MLKKWYVFWDMKKGIRNGEGKREIGERRTNKILKSMINKVTKTKTHVQKLS